MSDWVYIVVYSGIFIAFGYALHGVVDLAKAWIDRKKPKHIWLKGCNVQVDLKETIIKEQQDDRA